MRAFKFLIIITFLSNTVVGQVNDNYSDKLLSTSFKAYQEVDIELSNSMFSFIKERFLEHLKDTTSFTNPYDSLSKYIGIRHSSDSLVKTYSWGERDFGCCHSSEIYAQFKTKSGNIKFIDLKGPNHDGEDIFITDLKMIEIKNKPYYLILGWGTCCGGKHYSTAEVYEIKNDSLYKSEHIFDDKTDLYIGANRSNPIGLEYDPEQKILSYYSYGEIGDSGFYDQKKAVVIKWKLNKKGFKRIN